VPVPAFDGLLPIVVAVALTPVLVVAGVVALRSTAVRQRWPHGGLSWLVGTALAVALVVTVVATTGDADGGDRAERAALATASEHHHGALAVSDEGVPTAASTGPRVAEPRRLGRIEVSGPMTLRDVETDTIVVHAGARLNATNVRVRGALVVLPEVGEATTSLHVEDSAVHLGLVVNVVDDAGDLDWDGEAPVDIRVSDSWIHHPQGEGDDHTEALAGFGWPRGAHFEDTAFVQSGPFNGTATATVNWHGAESVFDECWFGWEDGIAAYYTVYVDGRDNVVRASRFERGLGGFVYPDSPNPAAYEGNADAVTEEPVTR
jgi:hypothetical protein